MQAKSISESVPPVTTQEGVILGFRPMTWSRLSEVILTSERKERSMRVIFHRRELAILSLVAAAALLPVGGRGIVTPTCSRTPVTTFPK
jgi:hypothetical protein